MARRPREYQLDRTSANEIRFYKKHTEEILQFHWQYYAELAYQRRRLLQQLQESLLKNCLPERFAFNDWQRAVKFKYSLDPLGVKGSLSDPGGRFNIGGIDTTRFPPFPALYLASNKNTALQELLGQTSAKEDSPLSSLELALAAPDSITIVRVNGELEQVFDLTDSRNLRDFLNLIKHFQLSKSLIRKAAQLKVPCEVVRTLKKLTESLLTPNWRTTPMLYDVPANPQIFGQIVMSAGIEGILYESRLSKQQCLAVFPQTFKGTSSFIELAGEVPDEVKHRRLDDLS